MKDKKDDFYSKENTFDKEGKIKDTWFVDRSELDEEVDIINNKIGILGLFTLVNIAILIWNNLAK
jgi:hypothetical protein